MIPIVEQILRNKVRAVEARLWTWEVTTTFDEELREPELLQKFAAEFPETSRKGKPIFKKMISFNGAEGRKHRYLVSLSKGYSSAKKGFRYLPCSLILYGICDRVMREREQSGNFRYSALVGKTLYVLVFFEGRLCHWSEEINHDVETAKERLSRFDEFLNQDELFSRADHFEFVFDCKDAFGNVLLSDDFWRGAGDHYWRNYALNEMKRDAWQRYALIGVLGIMVMGTYLFSGGNYETSKDLGALVDVLSSSSFAGEDVPDLEMPQLAPLAEKRKLVRRKSRCPVPNMLLKGVVDNRVAQIVLPDGHARWVKPKDSLQGYQVSKIKMNKIILSCGGFSYEIENGP